MDKKIIIVVIGPDSVSKSLNRIVENMKERNRIDVIELLGEFVAEEQDTSEIEFEMKMLDVPSNLESNEIILSNPVMADRHQIIESRKPKLSEEKAIGQARSKDYYRRKR